MLRFTLIVSLVSALTTVVRSDDKAPAPRPVAEIKRDAAVDFEGEILPILRRSCLACHNAKDAESELSLETPERIVKGGSGGPGVVAGKSGESRLFKAAAHLAEPIMPPPDNMVGAKPLSAEELGLLKLWIDQGAKGEVKGQAKVQWQPLPSRVNPIYAVAASSDGQIVACSRANQVFLYNLGSGQLLGRLTDPALVSSGLYKLPGVADFDLIQSMAFSPDGELLATGGYRTVKLWQRPRNVRRTEFAPLPEAPRSLAQSPDGKLTAIGDAGGKIQFIETASGKPVRTQSGHTGPVTAVQFTPDSLKLVSGSEDRTVRIWNVTDGANPVTLETGSVVTALVLVNAGSQVATAADDNMIRVWDLSTSNRPQPPEPPTPVKELKGHGGPVTSLAPVSSDGKLIASGSRDGTLRVWDVAEGRETKQFGHGAPVIAIAARPDGKRFASSGETKTIKLWNGENGQQMAELRGEQRAQLAVEKQSRLAARAKGRHEQAKQEVPKAEALAKTEADNVKKFTDGKAAADKALAEKQEAFKKPTAEKEAADKAVADAKTAVDKAKADLAQADKSANETMAALEKAKAARAAVESKSAEEKAAADKVVTEARTVRDNAATAKTKAAGAIPQAENNLRQAEQKAKQAGDAFRKAEQELQTAQSAMIAAGKALEAAQAVAKRTADAVQVAKTAVGAADTLVKQAEAAVESAKKSESEAQQLFKSLAFSSDGELVAAGNEAGLVQVWSAKSGAPVESFAGQSGAVVALAGIEPRDWIAVSANKTAIIWNGAAEWKLVRTIGAADDANTLVDRVISLAFSPDGKQLATGSGQPSRSGQLKIWNVADGALVREFADAHSDTIFGLDFSPDGALLASAAGDRFAKIWNVAEGKFVRSFEGHTGHVLSVTWKSDGRMLATSGADNAIKVWDFIAGEQRRTITGAAKEIPSLTFLGDGDELVSCSGDQNVRVHRANDGGNTRNFGGSGDFLYSVAATDDGRLVVAGGQDGVLRVWTTQNNQVLHTFDPPKSDVGGNRQAAK
jgi:WD40 repeat protein